MKHFFSRVSLAYRLIGNQGGFTPAAQRFKADMHRHDATLLKIQEAVLLITELMGSQDLFFTGKPTKLLSLKDVFECVKDGNDQVDWYSLPGFIALNILHAEHMRSSLNPTCRAFNSFSDAIEKFKEAFEISKRIHPAILQYFAQTIPTEEILNEGEAIVRTICGESETTDEAKKIIKDRLRRMEFN